MATLGLLGSAVPFGSEPRLACLQHNRECGRRCVVLCSVNADSETIETRHAVLIHYRSLPSNFRLARLQSRS